MCLPIVFILSLSTIFRLTEDIQEDEKPRLYPNIILINADDLGYGDLGCYGATKVETPQIDKLAAEGRRFTDAHSASAVCSPSRYGLLTGCYPLRKNLWGPVGLKQPCTLRVGQTTLASVLKQAGYRTAAIGKWHLGFGETQPDWNGHLSPGPREVGFDYYFGLPNVNSGPPFVYVENHRVVGWTEDDPFVYKKESATQKYPEKGGYKAIGGAEAAHRLYQDDRVGEEFTKRAVDWLEEQQSETPFFLYFATTHIHHPFTPAKRFVGSSECGLYGDFIHELDWMVGELMSALEKAGLTQSTLVIFTADNGGMFHVTGQRAWKAGHRMNGDLLGFKFGAWEGGHRVPMIVKWPGHIPAGTVSDHLVGHVDFLATLSHLVGVSLSADEERDSLNQWSTWIGSPKDPVRRTLILAPNSPKHLAIRHDSWVYIPAQGDGGFQGKKPGDHLFSGGAALAMTSQPHSDYKDGTLLSSASMAQLYNLAEDPSQSQNVHDQYPSIVQDLASRLDNVRSKIPSTPRLGWINLRQ